MITVVIKRTEEPKVIQFTQMDIAKHLSGIQGAEIILEDTWGEGLRKVRTPYVSLVEPDCTLSANYYSSNVGLMHKTLSGKAGGKGAGRGAGGGGYTKLAMISSCLGIRDFGNRIYNYTLDKVEDMNVNGVIGKGWHPMPDRGKRSLQLYHVQIGFVPGAIIRMSAIKDIMEDELWDDRNLVKLSTALSFYFWDTGRRIQVNSNTTYVSLNNNLEKPELFETRVPLRVANIFTQERIGDA
jgi:hypothetical protein